MVPDSLPQLTTVLSGNLPAIHLAVADHVPGQPSSLALTLCLQPVACRISAQSFHRLGCSDCAREAVTRGVTSIADRRQATVNLPRFLAALRLGDGTRPGAVPGQRERLDS